MTTRKEQVKQPFLNKLLAALIIPLTIVSCFSLYQTYQLKEAHTHALYQAEAMYRRNFGELAASVQTMHHQLAQLLVTSGEEHLLYGLSSLWREVYAAINALGSLPVAMHELEQTDLLLHDIAEYSYYLMKKNVLTQQPLSAEDWNRLENFYRRANVVQNELETLETAILSETFYLTSISREDQQNPLHTAFHSIEDQIAAFPAVQFEEGVRKIAAQPKPISGTHISETEAVAKAEAFLQTLLSIEPNHTDALVQGTLVFTADNAAIPVYGIQFADNRYIEVSQAEGHVLQYYHSCTQQHASLTADQAETQAYSILHAFALPDMVCAERRIEDNTASFVFVPRQDGVFLYPDMIKLQLALDDGTLLSFDQTGYRTHHTVRTLPKPALTQTEILKGRNPNFQISTIHPALIADSYSSRELLTYELRGSIAGETFSIFIDANTGKELRIVHL